MKPNAVKKVTPAQAPSSPVTSVPVYLTTEQVAKRYHFKVMSLANMRNRGDGPKFTRFGARVLYKVEDIETYLASRASGGKR